MQWNCTTPFLQNPGYDPFNISKPPSYPQIIGEGDVTSVIFPDGSIQLYFVPTNRHDIWSPFQLNANSPNIHCSTKTDIWFVRSISHPLPPSFLNSSFPNVYGDQQPPTKFNSNFCFNSPPSPAYNQKFHNDDFTSTTDIHYFYPSLRYKENLKYSAEVQTEAFVVNNTKESDKHHSRSICKCEGKKNTNGDASGSSTSYMSIDSTSKSTQRLNKKKKKKSKSKANKRDHRCECNLETKCASDKSVATYAEKASGVVIKGGRHTQTAKKKSKRSDIKTELWEPIGSKSRSMLKLDSSDSYSGKCCCILTSETDSY